MTPPATRRDSDLPPPPASSLNLYELTFGSVCGICAGVFIKKGAKFVAFILGGTFVLLQVIPISRACAFLLTSDLFVTSTSDLLLSSESTGLVPQAGLRTYSTQRRTVLDAHQRSDHFGIGSSTFWLQIFSHEPLSLLGYSLVCGSVELHVFVCTSVYHRILFEKKNKKELRSGFQVFPPVHHKTCERCKGQLVNDSVVFPKEKNEIPNGNCLETVDHGTILSRHANLVDGKR